MELALKYLPKTALVLFVGALVSALLSSADSALLAPASVVGWDVMRYIKPDKRAHSHMVSRISVIAFGLFALWLALDKTSVYDLMVDSWSILTAICSSNWRNLVEERERIRLFSVHYCWLYYLADIACRIARSSSRFNGRSIRKFWLL